MNVKYLFKKRKINKIWRKKNKHNTTSIFIYDCNFNTINKVHVGMNTYGHIKVLSFNEEQELHIGSYCSIGPNVEFVLSAEHRINTISTFPFINKILDCSNEATSKGDICIGDDVWIGMNSIILSGVDIGQGAVVAAGAVVTKNVPPYAIVAGNPAKIIKYRFSHDVILKLMEFDFNSLKKDQIIKNKNILYMPIDSNNIDVIIEKIKNNSGE